MLKKAEVREKIAAAMARATKADKKHMAAKRRLSKFSLFARIVFYPKFNRLRTQINTQAWLRLFAMREALYLAKVIKAMERRGLE